MGQQPTRSHVSAQPWCSTGGGCQWRQRLTGSHPSGRGRVHRASLGLSALDHLFKEVVSDRSPRLALLAGEPGIGKTSLAAAAARAAHRSGARVLYGRNEQYLGVPYQAWREALERLLDQAPCLIPDEAMAPSGVLRALGLGPSAALEVTLAEEMDIYLLFQGVVSILVAAAEPSGLVLALDDLQWSDAKSIQLLGRLLVGATNSPILVIGTFRDSELPVGSTVASLLSELRRHPNVQRTSLNGLNDLEVLAFVERQLDHLAGGSLIALHDVLLRETNGNPFFVGELVRHLEESGASQASLVPAERPSSRTWLSRRCDKCERSRRRASRPPRTGGRTNPPCRVGHGQGV